MALPKEPRQKMINLMYLVLTALLALNVSNEILNAFKIVNDSIGKSNNSITDKNNITYQQFVKQMEVDSAKVRPLKQKADEIKQLSATAYQYLENLKMQIIRESGGNEKGEAYKEDDLDAATRVMDNYGKGKELKKTLEDLRAKMLSYVDPKKRDEFEKSLPLKIEVPKTVENSENKDWVRAHFHMVPSVAAVTILSKFQNDVKTSEAQIVDELFRQIRAQDITFDTFEPFVSANSAYVVEGQTYEAQIAVGAYSSTVNPDITINGQKIPVQAGKGIYRFTASGVGAHSYTVAISLKDQNGQVKTYTKTVDYMVGASAVNVNAEKMNVMYIGVPNPISVGASGIPNEKIMASLSGAGSLQPLGAGRYEARVNGPAGSEVTINVSANIDGQVRNLGSKKFRVKRIPDPVPKVGPFKGGSVPAAAFRAQLGLLADLENFDFDAKFEVLGFRFGIVGRGFDDYLEDVTTGPRFTAKMQSLLQRSRPGNTVYIDDIKVKGPDGVVRTLTGISFQLR